MFLAAATVVALVMQAQTAEPGPQTTLAQTRTAIQAAHKQLVDNFSDVERRSHVAVILEARLDEDLGGLDDFPDPSVMSAQEYADWQALDVKLIASAVDQLATGQFHDLAQVRGLDEVLVRSPYDGSMQPAALYVPPSYQPGHQASLVVLLHGRTQTESEILAIKYFRQLSDATGTIIIAPYSRGDIQYEDPAPADVYATLEAAKQAFTIDAHRTFLVGYSMGGYGVYQVGPKRVQEWAGFLTIAGGPNNGDRDAVFDTFTGKPVYIVSGVRDAVIPNSYMRFVAQQLRQAGIPSAYYEQAEGTHRLSTIYPAIARAWHDMLRGIKPGGPVPAPGMLPTQPMHPD
jgi:S-formylglutathione hydrolase FrmB